MISALKNNVSAMNSNGFVTVIWYRSMVSIDGKNMRLKKSLHFFTSFFLFTMSKRVSIMNGDRAQPKRLRRYVLCNHIYYLSNITI